MQYKPILKKSKIFDRIFGKSFFTLYIALLKHTIMSNIIKHEQLPLSEIATISKTFADSGMFADAKNAAQAMVKVLAGQEIGIPPFTAMSGIHVIQGKPVMGAGIIASRVKGSGKYDYRVVEHTEKVCNIDFYQGENKIGNSTFTIEDAKKAGTKNLDKFPRNMLFARAISNGVKWYCPDVFAGPIYVPEEMQTITEDVTPLSVETKWEPTPEQWEVASQAMKDSTLDDAGKQKASTALSDAKTQKAWDKIVNRLHDLKTPNT